MALASMLSNNNTLTVLFLHWNKIKGKGAIDLANNLMVNECLQIFDSSFNSFGVCEDNQAAYAWSKLFEINNVLIHLDLSHNNFKSNDCKILSKNPILL